MKHYSANRLRNRSTEHQTKLTFFDSCVDWKNMNFSSCCRACQQSQKVSKPSPKFPWRHRIKFTTRPELFYNVAYSGNGFWKWDFPLLLFSNGHSQVFHSASAIFRSRETHRVQQVPLFEICDHLDRHNQGENNSLWNLDSTLFIEQWLGSNKFQIIALQHVWTKTVVKIW